MTTDNNLTPQYELLSETYSLAMREMLLPAPAAQLSSRFQNLNLMSGGFRPHEFSILCGATGVGKTTLLANWSASLLEKKTPHFIASVETGRTDFVKRVISAFAEKDFNTGEPVDLDLLKHFDAKFRSLFFSSEVPLSLYENRFSVETLMRDIRFLIEKHKIQVAMIDNLNFFLEISAARDQVVEMDKTTHKLIMFCKEVPIHLIMVMHPKKTDHGRVESEFDVKGSSTAVQESHNVWLFNRPSQESIRQGLIGETGRELKIAKMRRRGKHVGTTLFLNTFNGVTYKEAKTCR